MSNVNVNIKTNELAKVHQSVTLFEQKLKKHSDEHSHPHNAFPTLVLPVAAKQEETDEKQEETHEKEEETHETSVEQCFATRSCKLAAVVILILVVMATCYLWLTQHREGVHGGNDTGFPLVLITYGSLLGVGQSSYIILRPRKELVEDASVYVTSDNPDCIETIKFFNVEHNSSRSIFIPIHSKEVPGLCTLTFSSTSEDLKNLSKVQVWIKVVRSMKLRHLSLLIGWMYFLCSLATFYPQIYSNYCRGSAIGLSFNYLSLGITGFVAYSVFNAVAYWNLYSQEKCTQTDVGEPMPACLYDVIISMYAVCGVCVLIGQWCAYQRSTELWTSTVSALMAGLWVTIVSGLFAAVHNEALWELYLNYLVYVMLATVPLKYISQVHLNYARKSTEGWSIYSVMFDCAGASLLVLLIWLDGVNKDDLSGPSHSKPRKISYAVMSLVFDLIFLYQHYLVYGGSRPDAAGAQKPEKEDQMAANAEKTSGGDLQRQKNVSVQHMSSLFTMLDQ